MQRRQQDGDLDPLLAELSGLGDGGYNARFANKSMFWDLNRIGALDLAVAHVLAAFGW